MVLAQVHHVSFSLPTTMSLHREEVCIIYGSLNSRSLKVVVKVYDVFIRTE